MDRFDRGNSKSQEKDRHEKQVAIQNVISQSLINSARFGDLIYSRANAIKLGSAFGLIDLGICKENLDIFERPNEKRCKKNSSSQSIKTYQATVLNEENYFLEFEWIAQSLNIFNLVIMSLFISLLLSVVFALPLQYFLLNFLMQKISSTVDSLLDDQSEEVEIPEEFQALASSLKEKHDC